MAPSAHKRYKKFDADLQRKVKEESEIFAEDPYDSNILKGQLKGIRSYHFNHRKTQYRIAYRILEREKEIEIVLVHPRETFYQILRRIINPS